MPILTSFSSTTWDITLNRIERSDESALSVGDVSVMNNVVNAISGDGLVRMLTLMEARDMLPISDISIGGHPGIVVVSTENAELINFMNQIRNVLDLGLTAAALPDSVIREDVFLRAAELEVYEKLNLANNAAYTTWATNNPDKVENARIAVMYRTAAKLLYSLPQIISESNLQLTTRYKDFNIEEKINFWLGLSDDTIDDILPPGDRTSDGVVIATSVTKVFYY